MMFGATALLVLALVGFAVDYNGITASKVKYQAMADAAVLMAAGSGVQDEAELQALAEQVVAAHNYESETLITDLSILEDNTLRVEVSAQKQLAIMSMFGAPTPTVRVGSESPPKGDVKLNLALVLDVTGSMEGTKITTLKSAATTLVDDLDTGEPGDVMISVVPFSRYMKIPTSYLGSPWLEVEPTSEHCWNRLDEDASTGCEVDVDDEDGDMECDVEVYYEVCEILSWNGCMGSRAEPWDKRDYYGGTRLQGFAGGGSCHSELQTLSSNFDTVRSVIAGLDTREDTFIPSGLMWGWRTLSEDMPFTQANTADKNERKSAMLLMSDGQNTRSYGGTNATFNGVFHWNSDTDDANADTAEICANIKNDGIIIYSVAFEVTDPDTIAMMRNCATDPGKFFDAADTAALEIAFADVGKDLAQIRLSK